MKISLKKPNWRKGLAKFFRFSDVVKKLKAKQAKYLSRNPEELKEISLEEQQRQDFEAEAEVYIAMLLERYGNDFLDFAKNVGSSAKFAEFISDQALIENQRAIKKPEKAMEFAFRSQGIASIINIFHKVERYISALEEKEKGSIELLNKVKK